MIDNPDSPPVKCGEVPAGDELECLLESLVRGGAHTHANTALLLLNKWNDSKALDERRLLSAEIFCKFMQSLEDLGSFCLFCLSGNSSDISTYCNAKTRQIVEFYGRCRNGLPDDEIDAIYGLAPVDDLLKSGKIGTSQRDRYLKGHASFREVCRKELANHGLVFARFDDKQKRFKHSDLVNMYFNAKHGVRVFLPTPHRAKAMDIPDTHVAILIGPRTNEKGQNIGIEMGTFAINAVPKMVENTQTTCNHLKELAEIRLGLKKDPLYLFKWLGVGSVERATVSGKTKPGRNNVCFCGSGKKFKKCHGQ